MRVQAPTSGEYGSPRPHCPKADIAWVHSRRQLFANAAIAASRVTYRLTIFVGQDGPQPWRSNRGRCCFHDTAHESAIGENVEVVIASLAGRARGGRTFKTNVTSPSPQSRCAGSLDHLVRDSDDTRRNCQTERLRSVDIDHQLELGRRLYRKVDRFFALEHAAGVDA